MIKSTQNIAKSISQWCILCILKLLIRDLLIHKQKTSNRIANIYAYRHSVAMMCFNSVILQKRKKKKKFNAIAHTIDCAHNTIPIDIEAYRSFMKDTSYFCCWLCTHSYPLFIENYANDGRGLGRGISIIGSFDWLTLKRWGIWIFRH